MWCVAVTPLMLGHYRAARRALHHWLRLTERHGSLIRAFSGDAVIEAQLHYPPGDFSDPASGSQCYYHCHRDDLEHGHLHVFGRERPAAPLTHLIAISLDARGLPVGFFTVNQWVSRDQWLPAPRTLQLLDSLSLRQAPCDPSLALWLVHFVSLYRPLLQQLLLQRDHRLRQAGPTLSQALDNRDLEIPSSQTIDWMQDLAALDAAVASVRQAKQGPQTDADRGSQQCKHDPQPAMQAG